jgi:FKBP-type peptidyl-prolyl cis-trans isomerase FklB
MIQMMRIATLISLALLASSVNAAEPMKLDNDSARLNYSLGYQVGGDFKRQGVKMDAEAIIKGIEDALSGTEPMMSPPEMHATLTELKRKVVADERTKLRKGRAETELQYLAEGKKFMEENATKPGVKTTASGLQYRIIEAGKGKTPGPADQVTVNYRGTQINGNEFDSSYERGEPATFNLGGVIKGWTEGLQLIKEGGKIQLVIPPELAYAGRGPLAHRTLIFDVELITVGGEKQAVSAQETQTQNKQ